MRDAQKYYGLELVSKPRFSDYDCIVLAVAHREFLELDLDGSLVYDVKNIYPNAAKRL